MLVCITIIWHVPIIILVCITNVNFRHIIMYNYCNVFDNINALNNAVTNH